MGVGSGLGIWQMVEARRQAKQESEATNAQMLAQATETGRAEAKEDEERANAKAGAAATARQVDLSDATNLSKKKKGVNSTFVASSYGAGAGMTKDTTLTPIGS